MKTSTPLLALAALAAAAVALLALWQSGDPAAGEATPIALGELEPGPSTPTEADTLLPGAAPSAAPESSGREEVRVVEAAEDTRRETEDERAARRREGPFLMGLVRSEEGLPVVGARVVVKAELGMGLAMQLGEEALREEAVTDGRGAFRVARSPVPTADVTVRIEGRGFLPFEEKRTPDREKGDASLGDFALERGVVLAGRVVDADGRPVAGAVVRRLDPDDPDIQVAMFQMAQAMRGEAMTSQAETDAEGRFELPYEAVGDYALVADHPDHPRARLEAKTPALGREDLSVVLRFPRSATISGVLAGYPGRRDNVFVRARLIQAEGEDDSPAFLRQMGALATDVRVEPDEAGGFVLRGLLAGRRYEVWSDVMNGLMQYTPCSERVEVDAGTSELELAWESGATVSFELQDSATGAPLTRGDVRYRWTNAEGGFMANARKVESFQGKRVELTELRPSPSPGQLEIGVFVEGYQVERREVSVPELERVELGVIGLRRSPRVRVQVIEAVTGDPVRNARVVLRPESEGRREEFFDVGDKISNGRTDRDGVCDLEACGTETAVLSVRKRGFAPAQIEELAMPGEGDLEQVVRLYEGGEITVTVVDAEGRPSGERPVEHRHDGERDDTRSTASDGTLVYRDLGPGNHEFRIGGQARRGRGGMQVKIGGGPEGDWKSVVLVGGGEAALTLELPPAAKLAGRVTLRGQPVSGARVSLVEGEAISADEELRAQLGDRMRRWAPQASGSDTTGGKGDYELEELPLGRHNLRVVPQGGGPAHYVLVDLEPGENSVDVALPSAGVEGRVIDEDGRAIDGASVLVRRVRDGESLDGADWARTQAAMRFFGGGKTGGERSEATGAYRVEGVPEDTKLVLEVSASGYVAGRSDAFEVARDQLRRDVDVKLRRAGSIRVVLAGGSGTFQQVRARREGGPDDGPRDAVGWAREGTATLDDLMPGTWRVARQEDPLEQGPLVEVRAGGVSEVTLGGS